MERKTAGPLWQLVDRLLLMRAGDQALQALFAL